MFVDNNIYCLTPYWSTSKCIHISYSNNGRHCFCSEHGANHVAGKPGNISAKFQIFYIDIFSKESCFLFFPCWSCSVIHESREFYFSWKLNKILLQALKYKWLEAVTSETSPQTATELHWPGFFSYLMLHHIHGLLHRRKSGSSLHWCVSLSCWDGVQEDVFSSHKSADWWAVSGSATLN